MNKKQWYGLGIMFLICSLSFGYPVIHYEALITIPISGDAPYIVLNIRHQTYVLLMWLSIMATNACFICGLLEKEGAR